MGSADAHGEAARRRRDEVMETIFTQDNIEDAILAALRDAKTPDAVS